MAKSTNLGPDKRRAQRVGIQAATSTALHNRHYALAVGYSPGQPGLGSVGLGISMTVIDFGQNLLTTSNKRPTLFRGPTRTQSSGLNPLEGESS